jgi:hypothetical protein
MLGPDFSHPPAVRIVNSAGTTGTDPQKRGFRGNRSDKHQRDGQKDKQNRYFFHRAYLLVKLDIALEKTMQNP